MVTMAVSRFLSVRQVAEQLDVTERTVHTWLRSGRLRGFRVGGTKAGWKIETEDFERFIEERKGQQVADGEE
jgi:excisionase family DNA binding protein